MEDKREVRNTSYQVTVDDEKRTVEGYAVLFDTPSDGLQFEETIERGALDGVTGKSDVFALLNHDRGRGVLARSKKGNGSLTLEVDQKGLRYAFDAPKTALGDELIENIRRGEVDSSSFAFTVKEDEWTKKKDGTWKRAVKKIEAIYDVSPVYNAAYSKTSVYTRGRDDAEKKEQEERDAEMDAYYNKLENSFKPFNNL